VSALFACHSALPIDLKNDPRHVLKVGGGTSQYTHSHTHSHAHTVVVIRSQSSLDSLPHSLPSLTWSRCSLFTYQLAAADSSAVQCSAVQCSAVQCSAVQCSAVEEYEWSVEWSSVVVLWLSDRAVEQSSVVWYSLAHTDLQSHHSHTHTHTYPVTTYLIQ
jgi:hypothetical protein